MISKSCCCFVLTIEIWVGRVAHTPTGFQIPTVEGAIQANRAPRKVVPLCDPPSGWPEHEACCQWSAATAACAGLEAVRRLLCLRSPVPAPAPRSLLASCRLTAANATRFQPRADIGPQNRAPPNTHLYRSSQLALFTPHSNPSLPLSHVPCLGRRAFGARPLLSARDR